MGVVAVACVVVLAALFVVVAVAVVDIVAAVVLVVVVVFGVVVAFAVLVVAARIKSWTCLRVLFMAHVYFRFKIPAVMRTVRPVKSFSLS